MLRTVVMLASASACCSTPAPTKPEAPNRMTFMFDRLSPLDG